MARVPTLRDIMREESDPPELPMDVARIPLDDPRIVTLRMKRRYGTGLLRRMMQDAGYTDLARQAGFHRERLDEGMDQ